MAHGLPGDILMQAYDRLRVERDALREALESFRNYPCIGKERCGNTEPLCAGCETRAALDAVREMEESCS